MATDRLAELLKEHLEEVSPFPAMLAEALGLMSPEHQEDLLERALERGHCGIMYSKEEIGNFLRDPSHAERQVWELARETRDVSGAIESSVMFASEALHPETQRRPRKSQPVQPVERRSVTAKTPEV